MTIKTSLAALLRLVVVAAVLAFGVSGARAQQFIANQIQNLLSTDTTKVEITGLSGALTGALRIERVTVSDPQGVFLTASNLAMDWSPLALARANVSIEALTAGQIVLERLPQSAPADPNAPASSFSLPSISANIQKISVGEFVVGESIAGVRARLAAEARLVLSKGPTRLEVAANVDRLDQPGRIAANVVYAPADNRLEIKVDASEPAGGLVATLLKIPGAPAVQLTVSGMGPLSNFMANGALTVGSQTAATLTAQVADVPEGRRIAATLGISAERFVPTTYAAYVDGGVDLDAQVVLRNDGVVAIDQASLVSGRIGANASGTYDAAGAGNALTISIAGQGGGTIPIRLGADGAKTAIDIRSLKATLNGALTAAALDVSATLPTAGYGPYVATDLALTAVSPAFDVKTLAGPLKLTASASSVTAPEGVQSRFLKGAVRIEADGALSAAGITLATSAVTTGVANAALTGTAALNVSTFDLTLASDFQTLALSAAAVPFAGDRVNLSGSVARGTDGALSARALSVRGTGLSIDGTARLSNDTVAADVTGRIDVADTANAAISGQAAFTLKASGPVAQPDVDLGLTSQGLRVNGRELADLKLEARGAFASATPSGTVDLSGTLDGVPLSGTALVETLPDGDRRISNLAIRQGDNAISGELTLTGAGAPVGELEVAVADIGPLAALALQKMSGDLHGTIALSVNDAKFPVAAVDLKSERLAVAGTVLGGVAIDLAVEDYLGQPFPAGRVGAARVEAGSATVADLTLDLSRRGDFTRLEAAATANGVPVTLAGQARIAPTETVVRIDALTAAVPNAAVRLTAPATVTVRGGTTEIGALALAIGDGMLTLSGTSGADLKLDATLDRVPAAVANPFVPTLEAAGEISGTAGVTGTAAAPDATFDIRADAVETSQTRAANLPPLRAVLAGGYAGGAVTLRTADVDLGEGSIAASGSAGNGAIDLSATLDRVPVALANGFVAGLDASGTVSGTARATGALAAPDASFALTGTGITAREIAEAGIAPIEVDAAGRYAANTLTLERASATAGTGSLRASGTVGDTLALDVAATGLPVGLANGFVPGLQATGTVSGTATVTGTRAAPNAVFDLTGSGITARAVAAGGVRPVDLRLAGRYAEGTATLQTAVANIGPASLTATGTVGRTLDLDIRANDVPVGLVNGFVPDLDASGTISGEGRATGSLSNPSGTFRIAGREITAARLSASGIAPITLDLAGSLAGGTATIETARASVGDGTLSATGTVGQALDLKVDLARFPVGLANGFVAGLGAAGTLSGNAVATGSLSDPNATFQLSGTGITANVVRQAGLDPLTLSLDGSYASGTATLRTARLDVSGGRLTATGTVGQALDLKVDLADLPVAIANGFVSDLGATGTISGTATATGSLSDPAAVFALTGRGITARQVRASGVAPIELDVAGRYAGGTATIERADARIGDGSLAASGTVGQALDLKVAATRLPVRLADGFVPDLGAQGTLSGTIDATGSLADPAAAFDVTAADVSTAQTRAAGAPPLNAVARGRYANGSAAIETARVDVGGGTVTASGTAGQALDLDVVIANIPASIASAAASGIDPEGRIDGRVKATGSVSAPIVTYQLTVAGLSVAQTRDAGVGPLDIAANGRFADRVLTLDSTLSGSGLSFRAGCTVALAGTPQLDLRLAGTVPLAIANRILAEGGRSVQGTVAVDVAVSGAASAPNVTGTVRASGASFSDTGANVAVNDIAATITLNGRSATISAFSARLAAGGTIAVSGTVGLDAGFPADIRIRVAQGRYNDGELIAATLDADLTITGPLTGTPLLAGTIDANGIDIIVPDRLPTSLARIDVRHVNTSAAVRKQASELQPKAASGGAGGGIALDIRFSAPNEVFVRGRGLDVELGGAIRIQGSAAAPQITGALQLRRGRFNILANRLDFQRGILTFSGDLVPTLDLLATSDAGGVTVEVSVTGPATDPSFNFSSTPALPQDEVLARLIFGQGTANLSPLQIAQLAEAAAQLAGVGGSTGLLENLRAQLGVDDLDIKTNADGQTAVGVGRYLNDNTYLGVDSTGRVSIDLDLGAGLKARGAVSATGGGEVGVFYENEY